MSKSKEYGEQLYEAAVLTVGAETRSVEVNIHRESPRLR